MADDPNSHVVPQFRNVAIYNETASKSQGRPIYDDMEIVEIRFPGDRQKVAAFPAHEPEPNATREAAARGEPPVTYAEVYRKQYQAFKAKSTQTLDGTPLAELTFLTEAKRSELRALNIFTAESLAALDGQPLKSLGMGGRELKNQAAAYMQKAAGTADVTGMASTIQALQAQLREKDEQLVAMSKAGVQAPTEPAEEPEPEPEGKEHEIESLTDAQLKAYIKRESGHAPRGNPSRETLIEHATDLATRPPEEH